MLEANNSATKIELRHPRPVAPLLLSRLEEDAASWDDVDQGLYDNVIFYDDFNNGNDHLPINHHLEKTQGCISIGLISDLSGEC